jgi:hypothetical protein
MTPEEKERLKELCEQIEVERNLQKLIELLEELNDLLEGKRKGSVEIS